MQPLTYLLNVNAENEVPRWEQVADEYRESDDVVPVVTLFDYEAQRNEVERLQKENAELKSEVKEWLCLDCNTLFSTESIPNNFSCLICPKCNGGRMPKNAAIIKKLSEENVTMKACLFQAQNAAIDIAKKNAAQAKEIESLRKNLKEVQEKFDIYQENF